MKTSKYLPASTVDNYVNQVLNYLENAHPDKDKYAGYLDYENEINELEESIDYYGTIGGTGASEYTWSGNGGNDVEKYYIPYVGWCEGHLRTLAYKRRQNVLLLNKEKRLTPEQLKKVENLYYNKDKLKT